MSSLCSGWPTSASPKASTAPNILPTWSRQPPSQTQSRQSPCLMRSTSTWSSLRSPALKTSTMRCWSARRRLQGKDNLRESCRPDYPNLLHLAAPWWDVSWEAVPYSELSLAWCRSRCCHYCTLEENSFKPFMFIFNAV